MSRFFAVLIFIVFLVFISAEISSEASFVYFVGDASWYAEFSPGIKDTTANMETFDHDKMTCAIWGLPFDTILEVTNIRNSRSVLVRVNDRGPARKHFEKGRIVDLTRAAFDRIEDLDRGLVKVRIRVIR